MKYVKGNVAIEYGLVFTEYVWDKVDCFTLLAVQPGRTRSLVERWEQRERCINTEDPSTKSSSLMPEADTLRPSEVVSLCMPLLESSHAIFGTTCPA